MQPKPADRQNLLFRSHLEQILDHNHPLFKLANTIDWSEFEQAFGKLYDPSQGRPDKPIRWSRCTKLSDHENRIIERKVKAVTSRVTHTYLE
jgi:hypothetical protein